ncbi:MAG: FtsW/RodA/SpoVE family cell cycle protein [Planctomycetes bacterium]|jgi:cell division protein FtsW|nr:FtsW/RodA/SpoVE family cell cycle protein [Planctomycetota bacterium]
MDAELDKSTDRPYLPLAANGTGQGLLLVVFALLALGVVVVHSAMASVNEPGLWYARVDVRHGMFAAVAGAVLLVLIRFFNYRWFARGGRLPWLAMGLLALAATCAALVYVPGVGHEVGGRYRWIRVGPREYAIGFQPSELLKIAMVVFLAAWLTRPQANPRSIVSFALAAVVAGGCISLVITEDFGMAVVIALSAGVVMFLAGVPWYYLLPTAAGGVAGGWYMITGSAYRMQRVMAVVDPWSEANPSAYQARQSLTAILAGGWNGTGLGGGVQKLGFLPEDSTDFIFASFCEEWGVRGALLVMALLLAWMWQCRRTSARASDPFGRVLAGALGAMIAVQALLHIAVNMVVLPPTGIGMPFVSAGGTSLLLMAFAASLIVSVSARATRRTDAPDLHTASASPSPQGEPRPRPRMKVPRHLQAGSSASQAPPRPRTARPRKRTLRPQTPGQPAGR